MNESDLTSGQTPPPSPDGSPAVSRRLVSALRGGLVLGLLYAFLVGVKALEGGIEAFGSEFVSGIFEEVTNPVAGLFAGVLATVLVQSSSVTSATIVGLVGAGALSVPAAVPIIMGTNLGTTVTNTLVSLGHIRRGQEFRRAFAGATVHDFFNILTVLIALPLELTTGFLSRFAHLVTGALGRTSGVGEVGTSPIKAAISWPVDRLTDLLSGTSATVVGVVLLTVAGVLIFGALTFITKTMRALMAGGIERSLNRILDRGAGMGALAVGVVITILVQSSSITTSILIPMLAAGILRLENAYPVTLGANVGTTVTALLASVAADSPDALTIAVVHSSFNVFGILLFYPIPAMRAIPLRLATMAAEVAQRQARWAMAYVVALFIGIPVLGVVLL